MFMHCITGLTEPMFCITWPVFLSWYLLVSRPSCWHKLTFLCWRAVKHQSIIQSDFWLLLVYLYLRLIFPSTVCKVLGLIEGGFPNSGFYSLALGLYVCSALQILQDQATLSAIADCPVSNVICKLQVICFQRSQLQCPHHLQRGSA